MNLLYFFKSKTMPLGFQYIKIIVGIYLKLDNTFLIELMRSNFRLSSQ